jgi:hypothetical protein
VVQYAFGADAVFFAGLPVSSEPRQPISPSTDTPQAWAISTTVRVTRTL